MENFQECQQQLSIPIPVFPPFKLRSSLIDKDPVIWEYLLADYITLFRKLLALISYSNTKKSANEDVAPYILTTKSINQLHSFLQSFLHESSLESTQVFSLGTINPNIRRNQHILKLAIFSYIKVINLINLKLTGASIWEFCKVYITMANKYTTQRINQALITIPVIRKLVQGTIKSSYTSKSDDVSLIRSLQDYLGKLIASGKWKQDDSEILYSLLGQRTKKNPSDDLKKSYKNVKLSSKSKPNDGSGNSLEFAIQFVNKHWIEILEELYMHGNGINANDASRIMVLSLCSLSSAKILKLLKDQLEVDGLTRLKQFNPLVSCVVLSKKFNDINPDLKNILSPLLINSKKKELRKPKTTKRIFDHEKISNVRDLFPQLTLGQAKTLLIEYNDDIEQIINHLLESEPIKIVEINDYDAIANVERGKQKKSNRSKNIFEFKDKEKVYTVQVGKMEEDSDIDDVDPEFKKKNLARALSLLYEADEDEPDDTYLDNETVSGNITVDLTNEDAGKDILSQSSNIKLDQELLAIESKLFGIYSSAPDKLSRSDRNSQFRRDLRKETGWTDEQIEGWARMLQKSPKRFRMLEERLIYVNGSLNKSGKKATKWKAQKNDKNDDNNDNGIIHSTDKKRGGKPTFNSFTEADSPNVLVSKNNNNFKAYLEKKKQKSKFNFKNTSKTSEK
jgi:hypothetical protein